MRTDIFTDVSALLSEIGVRHGRPVFTGNWSEINWMNTPGPLYGADTDTCGTGLLEAPNNVQLDESGQEVIFRQPVNLYEVRQVVLAAESDPFGGYGADGDRHWDYENIKGWWSRKGELEAKINFWQTQQLRLQDRKNYEFFAAICRWQDYVSTGLEDYLKCYAFFLEEQRVPDENDTLPEL